MYQTSVILTDQVIVDAFAYRSELYCWTLNNELEIFSIAAVIEALNKQYGDIGGAAAYSLFCSRGIGASKRMVRAFREAPSISGPLELSIKPDFKLRVIRDFSFCLDLRLYYDRLYLATDKGAFVTPAHKGFFADKKRLIPDVLNEYYAVALSTGLRAVATSLGKLGLSIVLNEPNQDMGPKKIINLAGPSIRSSISASRIANFPSNDQCRLYKTRLGRGVRREDIGIADVDAYGEDVSGLSNSAPAEGYSYWDGRHKRLVSVSATRISAFMPATGNTSLTLASDHQLSSEPLSVEMTGNHYMAIESADSITLARSGSAVRFETGACTSLRTYRSSFRFRRLATCTTKAGLWLIAAYEGQEW
ncbi:hypothetical protein [Mycobacterium sp. NPDC050041]|uniref:hypothetical protein n=1 Tax=Mycobacterium sp. NPDC050041 TaxID=3364293 RepID=UPI003C2B0904